MLRIEFNCQKAVHSGWKGEREREFGIFRSVTSFDLTSGMEIDSYIQVWTIKYLRYSLDMSRPLFQDMFTWTALLSLSRVCFPQKGISLSGSMILNGVKRARKKDWRKKERSKKKKEKEERISSDPSHGILWMFWSLHTLPFPSRLLPLYFFLSFNALLFLSSSLLSRKKEEKKKKDICWRHENDAVFWSLVFEWLHFLLQFNFFEPSPLRSYSAIFSW